MSALFDAMFGPLFGYYAMIVFASLAGALWPLSNRPTGTTSSAALFVLRLVLTATVLTSVLTIIAEAQWGWKQSVAAAPIAFAIGAIGDNWLGLIGAGVERLKALARTLGPKGPEGEGK